MQDDNFTLICREALNGSRQSLAVNHVTGTRPFVSVLPQYQIALVMRPCLFRTLLATQEVDGRVPCDSKKPRFQVFVISQSIDPTKKQKKRLLEEILRIIAMPHQ